MLGCVLIEFDAGWDVVSEDASYEREPAKNLEMIGETDLLRIPAPPATETTQQELFASALAAIDAFRKGDKACPRHRLHPTIPGEEDSPGKDLDSGPSKKPSSREPLSG